MVKKNDIQILILDVMVPRMDGIRVLRLIREYSAVPVNVSECPLNISPEELTERFVRGDESCSAEGNGLGLSIAKRLMQVMHGALDIAIDGDLFKVILRFPEC